MSTGNRRQRGNSRQRGNRRDEGETKERPFLLPALVFYFSAQIYVALVPRVMCIRKCYSEYVSRMFVQRVIAGQR